MLSINNKDAKMVCIGGDTMDKNIEFYSRSDFEQACGSITRSTLRYYEREGILKPVKVDENGYKYYSRGQLYTYFHIAMLRKINCSVSEIRNIFTTPNAQYKNIFLEKKFKLDEMIQSLTQISKTLETINCLVDKFPIDSWGCPRVSIGNRRFYYRLLSTEGDGEHGVDNFIYKRKIDREIVQNNYKYLFYPMGVIINKDEFLQGSNKYNGYLLSVANKNDFNDCKCTGFGPSVTYSYTSGAPLTQIEHLELLRKYIKESGLTLKSGIHESIVPIRVNANTEAEYLNIFSADVEDDDVFQRELSYNKRNNKIQKDN